MTSELRLGGAPLELRVNKRARRLRLRVDTRTGGLLLTVPSGVSRRRALEWAATHESWAERALGDLPAQAAIGPGTSLPLFGRPHRVDWQEGRPRRWLRTQAQAVLEAETREVAAKLDLKVARVGIGDPQSRWGSCSSSGTIRYSWRLILAPDHVRRATVAHEVAHLVHMDHSPRFHALVEQLFGADPKPARLWLRREGAALHRIGR